MPGRPNHHWHPYFLFVEAWHLQRTISSLYSSALSFGSCLCLTGTSLSLCHKSYRCVLCVPMGWVQVPAKILLGALQTPDTSPPTRENALKILRTSVQYLMLNVGLLTNSPVHSLPMLLRRY